MHLHILGICGTFMAGIAAIAREAGHTVTGSDANAWPPMSTQLEALGIKVMQGYEPAHLRDSGAGAPDMVVVGNVVTRGNAAMEYVLDEGLPYTSGPQWLAEHVLCGRHVLAVAGTHGKTTTTSLLAWLLEHAGLEPGFLVGGVPQNFGISARLGKSKYFVIEADGAVQGGAGVAPLDGGEADVCELRKMYFLPTLRGRGAGQAAIDRCLDAARAFGFKRCYIETLTGMDAAQKLYLANGFERISCAMGGTGHHGCDRYYIRNL